MDLITEIPVTFTKSGEFSHPGIPKSWDESTTQTEINAWLAEQQITQYLQIDLIDALADNRDISEEKAAELVAEWQRTGDLRLLPVPRPVGEGWFLIAIYDTEEGPFAWWVTRHTEQLASDAEQVGQNAPPRPELTEEQLKQLALELVNSLYPSGADQVDKEQAAADICAEYFFCMDGYELAKALDDNHGWDITRDMIDTFDSFNYMYSAAQDQLERDWVNQYGIQAPLAVGQRVTLKHNQGGGTGTITEVNYDGRARYLIQLDEEKNPNSKAVVRYEDATALEDGE